MNVTAIYCSRTVLYMFVKVGPYGASNAPPTHHTSGHRQATLGTTHHVTTGQERQCCILLWTLPASPPSAGPGSGDAALVAAASAVATAAGAVSDAWSGDASAFVATDTAAVVDDVADDGVDAGGW